jgi:hypothetical protein
MSAILLSLVLFGADPAEVKTSDTPTTRLYVQTTPAGATIKVDGKARGTAPKVFVIPPGTRKMTVEVELDGRPSQRQELIIQGGRVTRLDFNFGPEVTTSRTGVSPVAPRRGGVNVDDFLRMLDKNGDGVITPDEVDPQVKSMYERMAKLAGLDPTKPIKIQDLEEAIERIGIARGGRGGVASTRGPASPSGTARGAGVSPVPSVPLTGMYAVPEGGVDELVRFIQTLSQYKPKTPEEDIPYRMYFRQAIGQAAEELLNLDNDPDSEARQVARFVLLTNRAYAIAQADPRGRQQIIADVKAYLTEQGGKGEGLRAASLAKSLGETLEQMGEYRLAAETLTNFAELIAQSGDESLSTIAAEMRRTAQRLSAPGAEPKREDQGIEIPPKGRLVPLAFGGKANRNTNTMSVISRFAGNGLAEVPRGEHSFGGVKFWVGDDVIHLASSYIKSAPAEVKGIRVGRKIVRLYVLHGGQYGDQPGASRNGIRVGEYRLQYADGTSAAFPIIYGEDCRDWWYGRRDRSPTTRGKVVWTGGNFLTARAGAGSMLRLYLSAWKNPHPEKEVASLDYVSALERDSAPFCVAMTVEEET